MRPLAELATSEVRRLLGVVFDLDGTLLTDGALTLEAYGSLFALRASGLRLVACTGRPAGVGAVIARQWPIDLAVTENGAIAFRREGSRVSVTDSLTNDARLARQQQLQAIVARLCRNFPDIPLADDHRTRQTDAAFDVGETVQIPPLRVAELRRAVADEGARSYESSIHVHATLEADDKASGTVRALVRAYREDATTVLSRYAFVGDSGNDEACFSAFHTTLGVANVLPWVRRLSVPPRFVASSTQGAGFVAIARKLLQLREAGA